MAKFSIFIFLGLSLLFSSCANPYETEIKNVSEMQAVLATIKQSYNTIEIDKVKFAKESYSKNMEQLQNYVPKDSITLNTVNLLEFYKGVKISAKTFEEDYTNLGEKIVFVENQLNTLKLDLENNKIDKAKLSTFLSNEKTNIETLQNNIGTMLYNYDFIINTHDTIASKIQTILIQNGE